MIQLWIRMAAALPSWSNRLLFELPQFRPRPPQELQRPSCKKRRHRVRRFAGSNSGYVPGQEEEKRLSGVPASIILGGERVERLLPDNAPNQYFSF
jgi:hypothetical protein